MRYFYTGDYYIPKHCKFGPRPVEGAVFNPCEWYRINDHLVRWEREKTTAAALTAKEDAKKEQSLGMTKTWQNTLASIKTQGEQKRLEKIEKDKQDKINQYNQILQNRKEEQKRVLEDARKIFYKDKDSSKMIMSSFLYSAVLHERSKQIAFKNNLKKKSELAEQEYVEKIKKDVESLVKEKRDMEIKTKEKNMKYKKMLDKQIADLKNRDDSSKELELEKIDLTNMEKEIKEIEECEHEEKLKRRRLSQGLHNKTTKELDLEKELKMEEEEETELNKTYIEFSRRFEKDRRFREKQKRQNSIDHREKESERVAALIASTKPPPFELKPHEKADEEAKKLKQEEDERERRILELKEERKTALEKFEKDKLLQKELNKWEIVQRFKREEINDEWREKEKVRVRNEKEMFRKNLLAQIKEKEELLEKEKREEGPVEDESANRDELLKYCDYAIEYAKRAGWPEYPVRAAVAKVKKEYFLGSKEGINEDNEENRSEYKQKPKHGPLGSACYCFKY